MANFENLMVLPFAIIGLNFLISGIFINFLQFILWLCLKPVNPWLYKKITFYLVYAIWGQLEFLAEWWSSSTCTIYTDDATWSKLGTEHGLLLLNHSYEVDWIISWVMCEQLRMLGSARAFVKKTFKMVPCIGWTALFAGNVFLERNWEKDKIQMENQIAELSDNPDPVMLHLFAEGTRFTPAKHQASVEFAVKAGLPPMKHLLVPRTKGFLLTVEKLRGKFPALYCATMVFNTSEGCKPTLKSMVLGHPVTAEVLLERIPLDSIPEDPKEASKWLHEAYLHKDHVIDEYKKNGRFPSSFSNGHYFEGPIQCHFRPRRLWTLLITLCSCYFTIPPVYKALYALFSSGIISAMIGLLLLGSVIFSLLKMIDLSSASKGSKYGSSPQSKEA